ncbi:MAG: DUF4339 domain-containing protein [Luteolibacter sp.]
MSEWHYTRNGSQTGPVDFEILRVMAAKGELNAEKDLVWSNGMKDWIAAGKIAGLFDQTPPPVPQIGPEFDPVPGSIEPLEVGACVRRAFDLTKQNFGKLFLALIVGLSAMFGAAMILGMIDHAMGWGPPAGADRNQGSVFNQLAMQVVSIFISLGVTRFALNLVSGRPASVSQIFGEGDKLLRGIGVSILLGLMIILGLIFLIVPGIWLGLKYGQAMTALVDRNCGVFEAFRYSGKITDGHKSRLMLLGFAAIVIMLAGLLALVVGLVFAYPMALLTWVLGYRWMQGGRAAVTGGN